MAEPWERQRKENGELEPMLWFSRFDRFYRLQGEERSLLAAYNLWQQEKARKRMIDFVPAKAPARSWFDNAVKWNWKQRAETWDAEQQRKRDTEWEKRRAEQLEREWEVGQQLDKRFDEMFRWPLYEVEKIQKTNKQGQPVSVQIIKPVKWQQGDLVRIAEAASKQKRLAAGMETESKKLDVTSKGEKIESLTTVVVREYVANEGD